MNTRKMLARLGPKTPQLTRAMLSPSAGKDALSPQDIAAALGYIRVRPGRELYEFLWIPNRISNARAREEIISHFAAELYKEQQQRMASKSRQAPFPDPPRSLCAMPDGTYSVIGFGRRIASACITELTKRNDCKSCDGFGEKFIPEHLLFKECPACIGVGTVPFSKALRAKYLGVRRETYADCVEQAYTWLLGFMREQEQKAAEEHWRALSD